MESAVNCKKYDLEDIADCFISWYEEGFCSSFDYSFDVGTATVMGIHGLKRGELRNGLEHRGMVRSCVWLQVYCLTAATTG